MRGYGWLFMMVRLSVLDGKIRMVAFVLSLAVIETQHVGRYNSNN